MPDLFFKRKNVGYNAVIANIVNVIITDIYYVDRLVCF